MARKALIGERPKGIVGRISRFERIDGCGTKLWKSDRPQRLAVKTLKRSFQLAHVRYRCNVQVNLGCFACPLSVYLVRAGRGR
eukprot:7691613-Pyramimonas_sp.AAC.1